MTALARDPDARFSSAQEMEVQLRRVAESAGLIAPAADVASWVRASLGPTLAARRAASMRGTGTTETPPPVAVAKNPPKETRRVPSDAPSAAETTGPLDPLSSSASDENTEVLKTSGAQSTDTRGDPRRRYVAYAALVLALAVATWAISDPKRAGTLFKKTAGPGDGSAQHDEKGVSPSQGDTEPDDSAPGKGASPPEKRRKPVSPDKRIEIDEDGHVVLPPIQPSGDE